MPAKNLSRIDGEGIYCHIYNKGLEGSIFNDEEDYRVFIGFLEEYLTSPRDPKSVKKEFEIGGKTYQGTPHLPKNYHTEVEVVAYSLNPNHFHLILHQVKKGAMEKFLRSLATRYSMYFNRKYKRRGALFEGPYKSTQIKERKLLPHLTRYLHHGATYSSYSEYLGQRSTQWIKPHLALSELRVREGPYKEFVERYPHDQKGHELIHHITLDFHIHHAQNEAPLNSEIGKENVKIIDETREETQDIEIPRASLPAFTLRIGIALIVFSVLVNVGLRNISISSSQTPDGNSTQEVLGETEKPKSVPTPTPDTSPEEVRLPYGQEPKVKPGDPVKKTITVKTKNEEDSVEIRIGPSAESPRIGEARNGETFELISKEADWYQVKLEDQTIGYIYKDYVEEEKDE